MRVLWSVLRGEDSREGGLLDGSRPLTLSLQGLRVFANLAGNGLRLGKTWAIHYYLSK